MSTRGLGVSCCGHVVSVRWAVTWWEQESFWLVRGLFGDGLFGTVVAYDVGVLGMRNGAASSTFL